VATNYINIGKDTIENAYSGSERIIKEPRARGIKVLDFTLIELAMGRGGPRCPTRLIY